MLLSEIFTVDRIKVDLASKTKTELFHELVSFLEESGAISDANRVMDALWQRESVMSTLVAPNIALPHASLWLFKQTVGAFGVSKQGIDYGAPDGKPVHLVMLLIDDRYESDKHLAILKKSARLVGSPNFLSKILSCNQPQDVFDLIIQMEEMQRI
ncbi:MAG TPA: PTS sugar transporter subunit IIA [Spirochaetia bacterium]|nr:PTS sugar transporter subunit IIA [Spirochaetia bacterium]